MKRSARTTLIVGTMELHPLGRTGMKVSPLCLGAMMFGAWRKPRPRRLRDHVSSTEPSTPGINFIDTADVYSQGESEAIVGEQHSQTSIGRRSFSRPRSTLQWATIRTRAGQLAALDHRRVREQPAPARH